MVTTLENDIIKPDIPIWLVLLTLAAGMAWAYYVARRRTAIPRAAALERQFTRGYDTGQWDHRDYIRRRFTEGFTLLLGRDRKMHWIPPRDVEHMRDEPPLDHLPGQAEYRARLAAITMQRAADEAMPLPPQAAADRANDALTTAQLASLALDDSPPIYRAALEGWRGTTSTTATGGDPHALDGLNGVHGHTPPPGPEQPREAEATAQADPSPDSGQPGPGGPRELIFHDVGGWISGPSITPGNADLAELVALADLPGPGGGAQLGEQIDAYLEGRPGNREHTDIWRLRQQAEHRDFLARNGLPAAELDWWEE